MEGTKTSYMTKKIAMSFYTFVFIKFLNLKPEMAQQVKGTRHQ